MKQKNLFLRIDNVFMRVTKAISLISPVVLVIMSLIATVNVVMAKVFIKTIPGNIYWITYLLVPVIYFAVSHEQLYRGLTYVDIFTTRFPWQLNMVIRFFSMVIGGLVFILFGYSNISKLQSTFYYKTLTDANAGGFVLWPFYLALIAMCFLLALSLFWSAVRVIYYKGEIPYAGITRSDEDEENVPDTTEGV